jgi:hypothetical protein
MVSAANARAAAGTYRDADATRSATAPGWLGRRCVSGREKLAAGLADARADLRHELTIITRLVRAEKLKQVADEFDSIHDIQRARRVGSVDHVIAAAELRPFIIEALERSSSGESPSSAAGGRSYPDAQAVSTNDPLRRHEPPNTGPSTARTWSGDQARSGGVRSSTVTSTDLVPGAGRCGALSAHSPWLTR